MAIRALQARVNCDYQTLERLWRTHKVFNEKLRVLLAGLFKMRRGECGITKQERELYQTIGRFISARSSRDAWYLFNSISKKNWEPACAKNMVATALNSDRQEVQISGAVWAEEAAERTRKGELLYDKQKMFEGLPACIQQILCRDCVAIIRSYDELVERWNEEHQRWLRRKVEWESQEEHKKYLAIRPAFEEFEQKSGGKIGKRRKRWHEYLNWLRQHPQLAGWRGRAAVTNEISQAAKGRILNAKPWKRGSVEAEEFWRANPELEDLDRLHGYYEREFVRRGKQKRNPDGFNHRPTFTSPDPITHPRWFVFNAPQSSPRGYRNLQIPENPGAMGKIEVQVLTGGKEEGEFLHEWIQLTFKSDPRLADFQPIKVHRPAQRGKIKGQMQEREEYQFLDRQLRQRRSAQVSGVRLVLKDIRLSADGSLISAIPYLWFTCNIDNCPRTESARKLKWVESRELTPNGQNRKAVVPPMGLITSAVDLGIRHLGFATLAKFQNSKIQVLRSRNLWVSQKEVSGKHPGRVSAGPDLRHIRRHKRELRCLRRLRGAPVRGEPSHVGLQRHITNMGEDRFKKAARTIINFALNNDGMVDKSTGQPLPRADVLLLENLTNMIPDAEQESGINRALAAWNRGRLVKRVKEMAEDAGLKVFAIPSFGTSQVCSRCGALGRRYSIVRNEEAGGADVQFGSVGRLFACLCGYRANADYNASLNLHRRFHLSELAVKAFTELRVSSDMKERIQRLECDLLPRLRSMHHITAIPF